MVIKVLWKLEVKDITKFSKCRPSELDSSGDLRSLTVLIEGYSLSKVHVLVYDFNFTVVVKVNICDIIAVRHYFGFCCVHLKAAVFCGTVLIPVAWSLNHPYSRPGDNVVCKAKVI